MKLFDFILSPKDPKGVIEQFKKLAVEIFLDNLNCVIVYGSVASGEFVKGVSDINIAIILKSIDYKHLKIFAQYLAEFNTGGNTLKSPLILLKEEVEEFAEAFPLEFLSIQTNHECVYGNDPFQKLAIDKKALKEEMLFELLTKTIKFRQLYLENKRNRYSKSFLISSVSAFSQIIKGLLYLKGEKVPKSKIERVEKLEKMLRMDLWPLKFAYYLKYENKKASMLDVDNALLGFPDIIDRFIKEVK